MGNIPRRERKRSGTSVYHVVSRGINKEAIFKEKRERTRMLNLIRENITKYKIEIYAYCIMSNHFHLLIKADLEELASFMAKIVAEFARYYNYKHDRVGYVFQGRYKSQCIEDISYFWNCLRYIHNNALSLKDIDHIADYKYSSMKELYYGEKDILCDIIFDLVAEKFADAEIFYEFHKIGNWDIFEDVAEESAKNKMHIARQILLQFESIYHISAMEVIDYNKTRQEFKEKLIEILHISVREANEIIKTLKKELKGTG